MGGHHAQHLYNRPAIGWIVRLPRGHMGKVYEYLSDIVGYSPIMLSLLLLFVLSSSCLFSTIYNHYSMSSARKVASISLLARNEVLWICTLLLLTQDTEEDTGA